MLLHEEANARLTVRAIVFLSNASVWGGTARKDMLSNTRTLPPRSRASPTALHVSHGQVDARELNRGLPNRYNHTQAATYSSQRRVRKYRRASEITPSEHEQRLPPRPVPIPLASRITRENPAIFRAVCRGPGRKSRT